MQCSPFVFLKCGPNLSIFPARLSLSGKDPGNEVSSQRRFGTNKQRETENEMNIPFINMSRKTGFASGFVPKTKLQWRRARMYQNLVAMITSSQAKFPMIWNVLSVS